MALRDWLKGEGWDDVFLDVDPNSGIAAGQRWERALNEAAHRCEAVLFLVSHAWLASGWCIKELNLAHRLNKRLFGLLVEDLILADLPGYLTGTWQLVRLCSGRDHVMLRVAMPITGEEAHVTFSAEGLSRLKSGLQRAGLDARFFAWPPANDPNRPPYRGLKPLEAEDAGIFFGRDAPIVETLDRFRGLLDAAPPRLLVILGASGAGKSSFLRAGILPRLQRDDGNFLVLAGGATGTSSNKWRGWVGPFDRNGEPGAGACTYTGRHQSHDLRRGTSASASPGRARRQGVVTPFLRRAGRETADPRAADRPGRRAVPCGRGGGSRLAVRTLAGPANGHRAKPHCRFHHTL